MLRLGSFRPRSTASRQFSSSTPVSRALPFFLNTLRAAAQDLHERDPRSEKYLRALVVAKPGAGKGTLTARLVKKYDILAISTGDLLRQHILERTEIGRQAEDTMAHGGLVPDDIMLKVVTSKVDLLHNKHWILDGFPRTLVQGEMLDIHLAKKGLPINLVVNLDVPDDIILSRISDRWVHLPSGRVYNMSYNRPKVDGFDDQTGEPLTKRPDDNPEIFARRLSKFYSATSPLLTYYTAASKRSLSSTSNRNPHQHPHQLSFPVSPAHRLTVETIRGTTSDEIWPKLEAVVKNAFPSLKKRVDTAEMRRNHRLSDVVLRTGLRDGMSQD